MKVTGFSVGGVEENIEINEPIIVKAIPNPFSTLTTISFSLSRSAHASVRIVDLSGRAVNELINGFVNKGSHCVIWDGNNYSGERVTPGIYFYHIISDNIYQSGRVVLIK